MANEFAPRKAEKKRVKLKMAVQGPSGSGKTWGALSLANNLWPCAKVCLIDTENESASLYADHFEFDTIAITAPYTTLRYELAIDAVIKGKYDVLIIDSITAQWDGEGGILRRKEEMDRRGGNSFTNWASFTPEHEHFKQLLVQTPIHIISTMRSKQEYALQQNDKGKQLPVKMGLAPIQRDGMDYEFTLVFDVQGNHIATASKDRTGLFADKMVDLADPKTAEVIRTWLDSGKEPDTRPTTPASSAAPSALVVSTTAQATSPSQLTQQLKASVDSSNFLIEGDRVTCTVLTAFAGETPKTGRKYVKIKFNGDVPLNMEELDNGASTFHQSHFPLLLGAINKEITFVYKVDKSERYINIDDLLTVDGVDVIPAESVTK